MTLQTQLRKSITETRLVESMLAKTFELTGKKPWKFGYSSYKRLAIESSIADEIPFDTQLPEQYGHRLDERIVELPWLYDNLSDDPETILDAGSSLNFQYFLQSKKLSKKKVYITTLAPEPRNYASMGVSYIFGDLRKTCFNENFFDTVACISTLEHVGLDNTMLYTEDNDLNENSPIDYLLVIKELKRVLKPGGNLFLTFPFGKPANYAWFQVFGEMHVNQIIDRFEPSTSTVEYYKYANSGWHQSTSEQCKDAEVYDATSNQAYTHDFLAFSRSVCCMTLQK